MCLAHEERLLPVFLAVTTGRLLTGYSASAPEGMQPSEAIEIGKPKFLRRPHM
jgi:hypothetical protein